MTTQYKSYIQSYGKRPRHLEDYNGYPCIITSDRYQARLLQKRFRHSIKREGRLYIVTLQPKEIYPNVIY